MLYWSLQIVGWTLYCLFTYLIIANNEMTFVQAMVSALRISIVGLLVTHVLRYCLTLALWKRLKLFHLLLGHLLVLLLSALIWEAIVIGLALWFTSAFTLDKLKWFGLLYYFANYVFVLLIWLFAYRGYHSWRDGQQKEIETLKLQLALRDAQLQGLKFQMNPHFLFNALNSIRSLVFENPEATRDMVTQLSSMLRYTLISGEQKLVTLAEEMTIIKHYLAIEKVRFEERLQVSWHVDEGVESLPVLPLSIQTLVENAVKHGISKLPKGGDITIDISTNNKQLQIKISNIGQLPNDTKESVGLKNTRERLLLQFGKLATFNLSEQQNRVVATMQMPLAER
jgi:two-component system LytT family sensor kinase